MKENKNKFVFVSRTIEEIRRDDSDITPVFEQIDRIDQDLVVKWPYGQSKNVPLMG
jgi:hypothetical protein